MIRINVKVNHVGKRDSKLLRDARFSTIGGLGKEDFKFIFFSFKLASKRKEKMMSINQVKLVWASQNHELSTYVLTTSFDEFQYRHSMSPK